MKKFLIVALFLTLISCEEKERFIHYTYKGVTLTRVDKGNKIALYYGDFYDVNLLPKKCIAITYNGFDGLVEGYLVFKKNKIVKVIHINGRFNTIINSDSLKMEEFDRNIDFIKWDDGIKGNFENVYFLSDLQKREVKINRENNSAVKAVYN